MQFFGMTNIGMKRQVNQDSFLIREYEGGLLAVVCDGMGGASGGEEASSTAVAAFSGYTDISFMIEGNGDDPAAVRDALLSGARAANTAVYSAASDKEELKGMGTTLVSSFVKDGRVYAVNIGDSRMYIVKDDSIKQITHDHSYVQYLVDIGKMTAEEAKESKNKNIITRAIGTEAEVEADFFISNVGVGGGYVVLCTDGLTNHIKEEDILNCVTNAETPELACAELVEKANLGGGSDNITVIVIEV